MVQSCVFQSLNQGPLHLPTQEASHILLPPSTTLGPCMPRLNYKPSTLGPCTCKPRMMSFQDMSRCGTFIVGLK